MIAITIKSSISEKAVEMGEDVFIPLFTAKAPGVSTGGFALKGFTLA